MPSRNLPKRSVKSAAEKYQAPSQIGKSRVRANQPLAARKATPVARDQGNYDIQATEDWVGSDGRVPQIDPTPSSNPPRPRTVRAGYIKERGESTGTLWVVFRDGTPWEYYDVPPRVWRNFRRVKSPGRFINRTLNNYPYGRGEF